MSSSSPEPLKQAAEITAERLRAVEQELAAVLYAVSHDLRAPLRAVSGFTQALQEHAADTLDPTALRYLERIQQANQKLAALIDALLSLSRVTQAELHHQLIDLTALSKRAAAQVRQRYPEQRVQLDLQDGMQVYADQQLLQLALEQLFDNAWKATARSEQARIEVNCSVSPSDIIVRVRDNGLGFNMQYAEKLFVPFQQLHASGFQSGLGIGLALVQRVASKLGGRASGEGEPDKGATFSLAWPNPQNGM